MSIRGLALVPPAKIVALEPSLHTLSQMLRTSPKVNKAQAVKNTEK